tara:strand:+ start:320 stop:490 length:171 start_codon:yes stop_codon:yes gene_type:complete
MKEKSKSIITKLLEVEISNAGSAADHRKANDLSQQGQVDRLSEALEAYYDFILTNL